MVSPTSNQIFGEAWIKKLISKDPAILQKKRSFKTYRFLMHKWIAKTNKKDTVGSYVSWISFGWCSIKFLVDWYYGNYTCYKFVTYIQKEMEAKQGRKLIFHKELRKRLSRVDWNCWAKCKIRILFRNVWYSLCLVHEKYYNFLFQTW